jgi:hypothetical protein
VQRLGGHSTVRVSRLTTQLQEAAGPLLAQLAALAADTWQLPGHPGWRLVTEGLVSHPSYYALGCSKHCLLMSYWCLYDRQARSTFHIALYTSDVHHMHGLHINATCVFTVGGPS